MKTSLTASVSSSRFNYLDFIRALACLPVLVTHLNPFILPGGGMGVGLFFALSGFLIAKITDREVTDLKSALRFLIRRIFRVFPLMIVDLALLAIAYQFFYTPMRTDFFKALPGLLFMQSMPSEFIGIGVGVLWTLQIEFAFYVLTPIFALILGRRRGLWVFSAFLVLASLGFVSWVVSAFSSGAANFLYALPLLYWGGSLGIGVLLYLITSIRRVSVALAKSPGSLAYTVFFIGVLGILALLPFDSRVEIAWHAQVLLASAFGATLILAWLMMPTIFVVPGAAFIGRISFSIYLIHAVLADFAHYAHQTWGWEWITLNPLVFAPVVIGLSYLSYHIIEQPGIRLGRKLSSAF